MSKLNILLTGSAGFIGHNLTDVLSHELHQKFYNVFHIDEIQDESDAGFWESIPVDHKLKINVGEITESILSNWKIDYVIHAAARSHVDDSILKPLAFTLDNTLATHNLLEACKRYGKLKKFVLVSTDEVMGSLSETDHPFREDNPLNPNSPYSASKASQEVMARAYFETFNLPVVITRCSNNYGLWQHQNKLIPKVVKCLINGEKIPVYGNGANVRDWIHVKDHCLGLLRAMNFGVPGEVYHFGGNNEMSNIELITEITDSFFGDGRPIDSYVKYVDDRLGHDTRYAVNSYKAGKELGWEPIFNDTYKNINEIIDWAENNKEWLNR